MYNLNIDEHTFGSKLSEVYQPPRIIVDRVSNIVVLTNYFYYLSTTTMPSLLKVSRWSLVRKEPILESKKLLTTDLSHNSWISYF